MTAIGFALFVVCFALLNSTYEPHYAYSPRAVMPSFLYALGFVVGAFLMLIGVFSWLWRVMP